ncbi:M15 family metallopeptidase, partial [Candidatus Latescibacterota bacterium]
VKLMDHDNINNPTPLSYWQTSMDAGQDFMDQVTDYPVDECDERMFPLHNLVAEAGVEVAFSDTKILPGLDRLFWLREGLVTQFIAAAREMNRIGWMLKIEDAYRSRAMQKGLALKQGLFDTVMTRLMWENGGTLPSQEVIRDRLGVLIARCPKTGTHMSGSALDISVLIRANGKEIDRGAPYLEMSELTPMESPFVSDECRRNREAITAIMSGHGFIAYPYEFWHYSAGDAIAELLIGSGTPGRYGAVDMDEITGVLTAIDNPTEPMNTDEEISARFQEALERLDD